MSFLTMQMIGDTMLPMMVTAVVSGYFVHRYYVKDNEARHEELKRIKRDVAQAQSLKALKEKLIFKNWQ